ncbi:MAG: hypothetical protein M1820_000950 [Bogoriella megaspora]|nr:MAG: hypothetical protein M1820_000950 [Bogoriella megaspora]
MAEVETPSSPATANGACKDDKSRSKEAKADEKPLPKLTPSEFRTYNHMAEHMDMYHSHFRSTWNTLYTATTTRKRPSGLSIKRFISLGLEFCSHLTIHHTIEEQHIFPVLAKRMPAFREELELLTQHKKIHEGLEKFEEWLEDVRRGERELRWDEMREIMDGFGETLWAHLDQEVGQLGAENMRRFWSLEEMRRMPM